MHGHCLPAAIRRNERDFWTQQAYLVSDQLVFLFSNPCGFICGTINHATSIAAEQASVFKPLPAIPALVAFIHLRRPQRMSTPTEVRAVFAHDLAWARHHNNLSLLTHRFLMWSNHHILQRDADYWVPSYESCPRGG